jgi:hypothetical protein
MGPIRDTAMLRAGQRQPLRPSISRTDYMLSLMRPLTEKAYGAFMTHIEKPDCDSSDGHVSHNDAKHLPCRENPAMTTAPVDIGPDVALAGSSR